MDIKPELRNKISWLREHIPGSLESTLGFDYQTLTPEKLVATMPVGPATKQPFGLLHGGASVALAESLASVGAWLNVDETKYTVAGMEINANHVRSMREGKVTGTGIPLHIGRRTQIWDIKIHSDDGKLVCVSRCTIAVTAIAEQK